MLEEIQRVCDRLSCVEAATMRHKTTQTRGIRLARESPGDSQPFGLAAAKPAGLFAAASVCNGDAAQSKRAMPVEEVLKSMLRQDRFCNISTWALVAGSIIVASFPLLFLENDSWDGVLVEYFMSTGNPQPLMPWRESGQVFSIALFDTLRALGATDSHILSFLGPSLVALGGLALALSLGLDKRTTLIIALLLAATPLLSFVRSSAFGLMYAHAGLGLLGAAAALQIQLSARGAAMAAISFVLLFAASQWQSTPIAVSGFAFGLLITSRPLRLASAWIIGSCFVGFLFFRFGVPKTGAYSNYNALAPLDAAISGFFEFLWRAVSLYAEAVLLLALLAAALSWRAARTPGPADVGAAGAKGISNAQLAIAAGFGLLGAMIPYAAVDKVPTGTMPAPALLFIEDHPWNFLGLRVAQPYNLRHLTMFSVLAPFLIGAGFSALLLQAERRRDRTLQYAAIAAVVIVALIGAMRFAGSVSYALKRDADAQRLVAQWRAAPPPAGVSWVQASAAPSLRSDLTGNFGMIDLTTLAAKATGEENRVVFLAPASGPDTEKAAEILRARCATAERNFASIRAGSFNCARAVAELEKGAR